jgi:thiamine-phosphate pyrophosphorylase
LLALCRRYGVPFIVNDYVDLCEQLDADGVHLGGTDAEVAQVRGARPGQDHRRLLLRRHAARVERATAGASYVAFGGFYPSRVKKYAVTTKWRSSTRRARRSACRPW